MKRRQRHYKKIISRYKQKKNLISKRENDVNKQKKTYIYMSICVTDVQCYG